MGAMEICLHCTTQNIWMWISLSAHDASVRTTIQELKECPIQHYCISHSTASDRGVNLVTNEVQQWAYAQLIY